MTDQTTATDLRNSAIADFTAMAENVRAFMDARNPVDTVDNLDTQLDAIISQKIGAALNGAVLGTTVYAVPVYTAVTAEPVNVNHIAGMDSNTGKLIRGFTYLHQRLVDALTTPRGSQCLLRARGSDLFPRVDQPINYGDTLRTFAAVASTLHDDLAGLPDFVLTRVQISGINAEDNAEENTTPGRLGLMLHGDYLGDVVEVPA